MAPHVSLNQGRHPKFLGTTDKTRRSYSKAVQLFFKFLKAWKGSCPFAARGLDEALGEFINHRFQGGETVSLAGWTLSGLMPFIPRSRGRFPQRHKYFRNWQRVHLPQCTSRLPWLAARAMAAAFQVQRPDLALLVLRGFAFFLHTTELVLLDANRINLSPRQGIVVAAIVNAKTSKGLQQSV